MGTPAERRPNGRFTPAAHADGGEARPRPGPTGPESGPPLRRAPSHGPDDAGEGKRAQRRMAKGARARWNKRWRGAASEGGKEHDPQREGMAVDAMRNVRRAIGAPARVGAPQRVAPSPCGRESGRD